MRNQLTEKNRAVSSSTGVIALSVILALVCHIVARRIELPELSVFLNLIRTCIFIALFSGWGVSAGRRVVQPQIRRCLIAVSALMVFWIILREIKFRFVTDPGAERFLWYVYYIPILLTPLIALFVSVLLGKDETQKLPPAFQLLYIPVFLLIAAFLSNDAHQLAFAFPQKANVWTEHGEYSYGFVFYAAIAWCVVCSVAAIIIMLLKYRLTGRRHMLLVPLTLVVLLVLYTLAYSSDIPLISEIDDVAAFYGMVYIFFFELCIRVGLIPSNTRYYDLFMAAKDLSLQITDNDYQVRYAASSAETIDISDLKRAEEKPVLINGKLLHNMPVRGGHAIWTEDVSELLKLTEDLRKAHDELNDRNEIVQMEYEDERQRRTVEAQNQLFDKLEQATRVQLGKAAGLTEQYQKSGDTAEKKRIIAKIIVLGSYTKRRKSLLLSIEDGGESLKWSSLENAIAESQRSLKLLGISGSYAVCASGFAADSRFLTTFYDFFEEIVELVMDEAKVINVVIAPVNGSLRCSVFTDCIINAPLPAGKYPESTCVTDEDGTQFVLSLKGAG